MDYTSEERALIFLCACTEFDLREKYALLEAASSAEELFTDFEKFFGEVILKRRKCVYKEGDLHARKEKTARFLEQMEKKGRFAVTLKSGNYPDALKAARLPPPVLFGEGNSDLLREKLFCVVGSRRTPSWAETLGEKLSARLSKRMAVVSGLAEGGDSAAMRGALSNGKAVCVLPCGLDECYPAAHLSLKKRIAENGLLLTECRDGEKVGKYSFHYRNRILAGISVGTLVLSAAKKSGALITAYEAVDLGREVFALPHNAVSECGEGCNELIKKGAYLCTDAQDIFDVFGIEENEFRRAPDDFTAAELEVIGALCGGEAVHTAVIAEMTGLPVYEVSAALSSLELKGAVVKSGANRYLLMVSLP